MIMKANKQIGFIYKNNESIDKILKDGEVVFERGFLREKTSTTLPITFGGVGKDLKDYMVYGNTYQNTTSGKNLFYLDTSISYGNGTGITITKNADGSYTLNGNSTGGTIAFRGALFLNETHSLSYTCNKTSNTVYVRTRNGDITEFGTIQDSMTCTVLNNSVSSSKEIKFVEITVSNNATLDNFIIYPQIELGPSSTEFEPYTGGQPSPNPDYPQEIISCGDRTKNLIPTNIKDWEQGTISQSGTNQESTTRIRTIDYYKINNDTDYYVSIENENYTFLNIMLYDYQKQFIGQYYTINREISSTRGLKINIASLSIPNVKYCRVMLRRSNNSTITPEETSIIKPMITLGDTKLNFEPYGYKIPINVNGNITNIYLDEPLRKIDGYSDYIDFINSKVVRNIDEIILNGSEDWVKSSRTDVNRYYAGPNSNPLIHTINNRYTIDLISDYFKCISPATSDNGGIGLAKYNATGFLLNFELSNTNFDTLSKFLNWLSTHNTTVYYVLATPTEEAITLPNIPTVEGNNTLNIETEITPSQVYIKYKSNE